MGTALVKPHYKVYFSFFVYALLLGGIHPRLGDLQLQMGIGEGVLGLALLGFSLGTQASLIFAGSLIEKLGFRWTLFLGLPLLSLAEIAATIATSPLGFFSCLMWAGFAIGALEIIINLEADRTEHLLGKRIMNRSHGFWSLGFFAAGLFGAGFSQLAISPTVHLLIVGSAACLLVFIIFNGFTPAPARTHTEAKPPGFIFPTFAILSLAVFSLSASLMEGAAADWSVIFMRDSFSAPVFINGLAITIGALSQAISRFFADDLVERFGVLTIARGSVIILGIGVVSVFFSPVAWFALAGFALMGVGTSVIFPLAMSAAAQRTDRTPAINVATFAQISFVAFLLGPPLLGLMAEHWGIRTVFAVGIPLVLLSLLTINSLKGASK